MCKKFKNDTIWSPWKSQHFLRFSQTLIHVDPLTYESLKRSWFNMTVRCAPARFHIGFRSKAPQTLGTKQLDDGRRLKVFMVNEENRRCHGTCFRCYPCLKTWINNVKEEFQEINSYDLEYLDNYCSYWLICIYCKQTIFVSHLVQKKIDF